MSFIVGGWKRPLHPLTSSRHLQVFPSLFQPPTMKLIAITALCLLAVAAAQPQRPVVLVLRDNSQAPAGDGSYRTDFELDNGIQVQEEGRPGIEGQINVQGSYVMFDADGNPQTITYYADENGYRAEGALIPARK